jgi:hypothetical protein
MIKELTGYYSEVRILSTNFDCKYYDQCVSGSKGLIKGKAAYIGSEYENHTLPRILFVSLDPGSDIDYETLEKRTPEGVRAIEENRNWQIFNPLLHWYATHILALRIAQVINPTLTEKDANQIFSHTNCAKCCYDKVNNDMSGSVLYRNCRNYLSRELSILDPEILIGQGLKAQEAIAFSCKDISNMDEFLSIVNLYWRIHVATINNHPVLYIQAIYPSWRNDRTRKQEKELYPIYLTAVKAFAKQMKYI